MVGAANRLAFTAAKAVAESPGTVYNPLFIYARPGLGKTHLLMGIGHAARAINPRLAVEYLTLDEFVESFHAAIAAGQGEAYRRRFIDVDLLLVDDVQFLTHRREMQAELLRLSDALQTANRQIVLTSDRPPAEIEALDERLIRRFAGGLVIDIAAPDYETRVAILRRKAEERRASFGEGVLEAVARSVIDNVRELLGALNRLVAFQAVSDTPLKPAQARALAGGADGGGDPRPGRGSPRPEPRRRRTRRPPSTSSAISSPRVSATVAQQVDSWRTKVGRRDPALGGRGFSTARLEALLAAGDDHRSGAGAAAVRGRRGRLQALHAEAAELAPDAGRLDRVSRPGRYRRRRGAHCSGPGRVRTRRRRRSPLWRLDDLSRAPATGWRCRRRGPSSRSPASRYNPLVIVGASGVGKTHLLHAVGQRARRQRAKGPVACLSAHEFTGELIEAIDRDAVGAWRATLPPVRRPSCSMMSTSSAEKDRTQDELFVLFNFLVESGRQMIFTSALPLRS